MALGGYSADGRLDILNGRGSAPNKLHYNDGNGVSPNSRPLWGLLALRHSCKALGRKVLTCAVADVQYPYRLSDLIHFVKDAVNIAPLAQQQASNLPSGLFRLSRQWTTVG